MTRSIIGVSIIVTFTLLLLLLLLSSSLLLPVQSENSSELFGKLKPSPRLPTSSSCIVYDKNQNSITIKCPSAHLTDVYNQLHNPTVLTIEEKQQQSIKNNNNNNINNSVDERKPNIWLLNATIIINKGSLLTIDPKDTKWLKILTTPVNSVENNVNRILVYGSLKIDTTKVTSWNKNTNYYALTNSSREYYGHITHAGAARPFIATERGATGTTNITNSEIAYLGYEGGIGSGTSGLEYRNGGDGSVLRGNNIHHLYFGFYSIDIRGMIIENNQFHNSGHYGIDPHTGTHDMIIRHNIVYDTNGTGIICSLNCYNILIEDNKLFNNTGDAISFTRNVANSTVRNNYIENQANGIFVSQLHHSQVYNNTISNDDRDDNGIVLGNGSSFNKVFHNMINNIGSGITLKSSHGNNTIYNNQIINSHNTTNSTPNNNNKFVTGFVPIANIQVGPGVYPNVISLADREFEKQNNQQTNGVAS